MHDPRVRDVAPDGFQWLSVTSKTALDLLGLPQVIPDVDDFGTVECDLMYSTS